jgi:hypothetical protein
MTLFFQDTDVTVELAARTVPDARIEISKNVHNWRILESQPLRGWRNASIPDGAWVVTCHEHGAILRSND